MKKSLLKIIAVLFTACITSISTAQTYTYTTKGPQGLTMTSHNRSGVSINYSINELNLNSLNYKGEEMSEISISSFQIPNDEGLPNLPRESRFFAIPQGAKAVLNVISCEKSVIKNVNLAPALKIQSDNDEPDMNYVKDAKVYSTNAAFPEKPFELSEPISLRGVDAVILGITPFQYNPVTKELTVYSNIELSIEFIGGNGHFGEDRLRSPYWDPILEAELMNYNELPAIDYSARMQEWTKNREEGWEYLIITPNNDAWTEYANQLKDFRTRQGILTEVMRLDEMGVTNTEQMKTWFHNAYNTWEIAPVAVCLLGDHGTNMSQYIPAITTSHPASGTCITDNQYADPSGDNLPDMCFSRLVAQSEAELPVFVSKQIEYETQPCMDASYYHQPITALGWQTERWFQICSEVVGGYWRMQGKEPQRINAVYSGTPGSSWSSAQNTSSVTTYFGPNGLGYLPAAPSELGGWTGGTGAQVVDAVNQGVFMLQHRDHGGETLWGEPSFSTSNVAQMTNAGKLAFVMSINCLTGKYNYSSNCLMEAFMRHTYNGENAGAVGLICPTEISYSFVNDAFVWGMYDLFDPQFMPDYGPYADYGGNWMPAFGNVAGKYFLNQCTWPYNDESKDITYTMFTAHCDAFLRLYTEIPQEMTVIHPEVVLAGLTEVNVTAPEGSTISLVVANQEGGWNIIGVAQATGAPQNITIPAQVPPTEINIICTGQNYLRYEDVISVVPAEGPYIVFDSMVINDENNNEQVDFGENISLDVTMKNVGSETIGAFEAVLSTTSEYVTITNATAQYTGINANATGSIANAFSFTVADDIPNNTNLLFTISVNNGDDDYISNFSIKAYAPILKINNMSINDENGNANGRLEAGEEAQIIFNFENEGMSAAPNTLAVMQMLSPYIIVDEANVTFETVGAGESVNATYDITVDAGTPVGYACPINFNVTSGNYSASQDFTVKVGLVIEDFESGELSEGWENDSNHPWTFVTEDPYEGTYCLRSGTISDNSSTNLTLTHEAGVNDTISFYYKVSSETNYDKLHFYIDNVEKETWSGTASWSKVSYPVSAGNHTYKWSYSKDSSVSNGSDCAWIDYVSLPAERTMAGTAGLDINICEGNDAQLNGYAIHYQSLQWSTAGDGTFSNSSIVDPIYTPGNQDITNREVILTLTITGEGGQTITDNLTLSIFDNIDIMNALIDYNYCAQSTPQDVAIEVVGDYASVLWTTSGDGSFENANEVATTYTPGANDIEAGQVNIIAVVESMGCGPVEFEYPFNMNPAPQIEITTPEINACSNNEIILGISASGSFNNPANPMAPDYVVVINGAEYEFAEGTTTITLPAIAEAGVYSYHVSSIDNGTCSTSYGENEKTFTINVSSSPTLVVDNAEHDLCNGEMAVLNFTFTGIAPFEIEATGLANFTSEENTLTMTLDPEESINAVLTSITDATGCTHNIEQVIRITLHDVPALPVIDGQNELDIYYTPVSTYTADSSEYSFNWTLTPENAGSLVSDGNSVEITWSNTFSGNATLAVVESNSCGESEQGTLVLNLKNSTSVSESEIVNPNIYPNPANNELNIEIESLNGLTTIEVYNILGERVMVEKVTAENGLNTQLNLNQVTNGTYLVKIMNNDKTWVKNIVIKK
jgi:Peptidase family C25./Propeptide_C25.